MPVERAGKGRKDSMPSTPPGNRAIAAQQFAPEAVKPSTPSARAPQKKTNTKPVSKKEASAGPPTAQVASSIGTRKPAWNTDSISERLAEATKADPRKSEAAAASGPPETKSPQTKSPQTKSPETKRNIKRWADTAMDANVVGEFYTSTAVPAKQTEDLCSVQCGSEESEKTAPSSGEDVFSKEGRHRTLSALSTLTHVSDFGASSSAQSETSAHVSDFGVSSREKIADWVDEADEQEDLCEEDGEEDADDEDWQWQCPDGYPLAEYVCAEPTLCGSCGGMQPVGAKVLWAEESGWAACEECVRLAYDQPISHHMTEEECDTSTAALDPSSMTTEQIAAWFKEHGAENFLRQCMQQVMASNSPSQRDLQMQDSVAT
jgi:hypothetical protein